PEFHGSKTEEDPKAFLDEVYKIMAIMGVSSEEKAELAAYQLIGLAQIWYEQWRMERLENVPIQWEAFKVA
ncbi:hypothetical protein, partial [Microbacterium sp. C7(2022)]|uniref:hypothetical protein n=1 Tax=Microbacterium sp. C7(2022) TaxID=2992759 RepID=UPI00237AAE88